MLGKQYDRMETAMTTIAIIGAGIVGSSAAYYLKKQGYQQVTILMMVMVKQLRQPLALSALGFQKEGIRLGTSWLG